MRDPQQRLNLMKLRDYPALWRSAPRNLAIFSMVAAANAGQASIPTLGQVLPTLLSQARFVCILVALGCAILAERKPFNPTAIKLASALAILCAFLGVSAMSRGTGELATLYVVDVTYLATFGFLAAILICDEHDLSTFCGSLVVIAIPFAPAWYFRDVETFTGFTTITYFRVEFFAFVACTYFAVRGSRIAWIGSAIFLFLTMDSTSKSGAVLAPISIVFFCFILAVRAHITTRPFRYSALSHLALLILVILVFVPTRSSTVASRIAVVGIEAQVPEEARNMDGQARNNLFTFNDGTQRVRMATRAIELWSNDKLNGIGIGNYHITLLNGAWDGVEPYYYPHNVTLEILYSTGIIGFAIYAAVIVAFLIVLFRQMLATPEAAALGCGAILVLLTSHFAGDFYDMRMFWLFVIVAAGMAVPASYGGISPKAVSVRK